MEVVSTLEAMRRDMDSNVFNHTKDGKCSQCGECCGNILPCSQKEIDEIHRYVKRNHIKECRHLIPAVAMNDMICPFLDMSKRTEKCIIYEVRPEICRFFLCASDQRKELEKNGVADELFAEKRNPVNMREEFFG